MHSVRIQSLTRGINTHWNIASTSRQHAQRALATFAATFPARHSLRNAMSNRATLDIAARPSVQPVMHVRPMSIRHAPDMEVQALERLASACTTEKYRERVNTLGADERFDRALSRIEDLMLFFIRMCEADEHYMQRFDEDAAAPGSELARARAAASLLLRAVAWDAGHVSPFHPLRTQNELLGMQIDDFCEVVNKYLSQIDGAPEDWKGFWNEVYMLFHSLGSSLAKLKEKQGPAT